MQKVPIDAGFSCPNLDGKLSGQGCIYCNNRSFSPFYSNNRLSISSQLRLGIEYFRKRYKCQGFFAYFQSFSCTYAPIEQLREKYNEALAHPEIAGLIIATRPDCLNNEVLSLLTELGKKYFVRLELGIESFDDDVLKNINRCHDSRTAMAAMQQVVMANIPLCLHLIFGLPGEKDGYLQKSAGLIADSGADMVKLHHLQVIRGSRLAQIYHDDPDGIHLHSLNSYLDELCIFIAHLPAEIAIDRFINRVKRDDLIAPIFKISNEAEFQQLLIERLKAKKLTQGTLFSKRC